MSGEWADACRITQDYELNAQNLANLNLCGQTLKQYSSRLPPQNIIICSGQDEIERALIHSAHSNSRDARYDAVWFLVKIMEEPAVLKKSVVIAPI